MHFISAHESTEKVKQDFQSYIIKLVSLKSSEIFRKIMAKLCDLRIVFWLNISCIQIPQPLLIENWTSWTAPYSILTNEMFRVNVLYSLVIMIENNAKYSFYDKATRTISLGYNQASASCKSRWPCFSISQEKSPEKN